MATYAGQYLRIDLTTKSWETAPISDADVQQWLLGSGLAAKLFFDEMDATLDPLDPASPLLVFNGVLTGTFAPTGARSSWCGRSPLTGIWNEANLGGHWGAELRFAGYDGLVITGRAETPVYLWINGITGEIELRVAGHLWGKDYFAAADTLLAETDARAQVAGIGQAGENLVKISGIMSGPSDYVRTAARGGMGAVLGSKNLKAIVVRGKNRPQYVDKTAFRNNVKAQNAHLKTVPPTRSLSELGTAGGTEAAEWYGDMPLKNWSAGSWQAVKKLAANELYDNYKVKDTFCFACPIGCGKEVENPDGKYAAPRGEGVEYETIAGFGGMTQVDNIEAVILANSLCNRYGMDTISASSVIAFAMEAFEKGIIGRKETGGLELTFGNADAMVAMVEKIALRQDIGDTLAEGVRAAAKKLGNGAEAFAVHVKGMEVPYHDPRAFVSMAVNYATANRGACHLESLSYWNGYGVPASELGYEEPVSPHESTLAQAKMAVDYQNYVSVFNPLGLCKFIIKGTTQPSDITALLAEALGWQWSNEQLLLTGERIFQLKRLINRRYGISAADDVLPPRLQTEARPDGEAGGVLPKMDAMLPEYYRLRGWDAEGTPTAERLQQVGLA